MKLSEAKAGIIGIGLFLLGLWCYFRLRTLAGCSAAQDVFAVICSLIGVWASAGAMSTYSFTELGLRKSIIGHTVYEVPWNTVRDIMLCPLQGSRYGDQAALYFFLGDARVFRPDKNGKIREQSFFDQLSRKEVLVIPCSKEWGSKAFALYATANKLPYNYNYYSE